MLALEPGSCVVNPEVGREYLLKNDPAPVRRRRILVAGAGPAGLAAARMAAIKGHHVMVCEESARPGGLMRLAAKAPGRAEVFQIVDFLVSELERLTVEVRREIVGSGLGLVVHLAKTWDDQAGRYQRHMEELLAIRGVHNGNLEMETLKRWDGRGFTPLKVGRETWQAL